MFIFYSGSPTTNKANGLLYIIPLLLSTGTEKKFCVCVEKDPTDFSIISREKYIKISLALNPLKVDQAWESVN